MISRCDPDRRVKVACSAETQPGHAGSSGRGSVPPAWVLGAGLPLSGRRTVRTPQEGWLPNGQVPRLEVDLRVPNWSSCQHGRFVVHRSLSAAGSSLVEGMWEPPGISFPRAPIPFLRAPHL